MDRVCYLFICIALLETKLQAADQKISKKYIIFGFFSCIVS